MYLGPYGDRTKHPRDGLFINLGLIQYYLVFSITQLFLNNFSSELTNVFKSLICQFSLCNLHFFVIVCVCTVYMLL